MATRAPAKAAAPATAAAAEPVKKKSKGKLILLIVLVVVLLAGGGGAAWYFLSHKNAEGHDAPADAKAKAKVNAPPVFFPMEAFTVNLRPGEGAEQFLQVSLTVQAADQAQVETIKQYLPRARSRLLLLLSSKTAAEILTVEGKKKLITEIVEQLRQPFAPQGEPQDVTDVLITSFVVQ